jgi:di/tricarboxylate transporter
VTFAILGATIVGFVSGKVRPDLVAVLSMLALLLAGVIDVPAALSGFSDPAVIMIAALFVVGEGLSATGVTAWLGDKMLAASGGKEIRLMLLLMSGAALLSAFVSNTGTVATLLPAVMAAAYGMGAKPSQFLIPLAFAANVGGLLTLTGTPPNIVVAGALEDAGLEGFAFFEFALLGGPLLVAMLLYMRFVGRKTLPERGDAAGSGGEEPASFEALDESYGLRQGIAWVRVPDDVPARVLGDIGLELATGITVLDVEHADGTAGPVIPRADTPLLPGDLVLVKSAPGKVEALLREAGSKAAVEPVPEEEAEALLLSRGAMLAEVVVAPRSRYIGHAINEGRVTRDAHAQVLSVRRRGRPLDAVETRLEPGDAVLFRCVPEALHDAARHRNDFIVLGDPQAMVAKSESVDAKALTAVGVLVAMIVLMVTGVLPTVVSAILAAAAMVLFGCVPARRVYQSVGWASVVLIAAMIPMSAALRETGGAAFVADGLVKTLGQLDPRVLMAGIFLLTTGFSQVMNNTATAVLVTPIVFAACADLGVDPHCFLIVVTVAASTAFLTPIGTTTNLIVFEPGGYEFTDYLKVGLPIVLLFLVITLALAPVIWPL